MGMGDLPEGRGGPARIRRPLKGKLGRLRKYADWAAAEALMASVTTQVSIAEADVFIR
jgi:hypothetical protein